MNIPDLKSVRTWFHARSYATVSPVRDWGLLLGSTTALSLGCATLGTYAYLETTTLTKIDETTRMSTLVVPNEENLSEIMELLRSRRARVEEIERTPTSASTVVHDEESLEMVEVSEISSSSSALSASSSSQDMSVE
ncbi:MAG: hypothetical protein KBD21_01625 [Candidatus Pacebacteria bacterium]|nr:hypothetical protein [Candidatus Paceibacterota bacterium]